MLLNVAHLLSFLHAAAWPELRYVASLKNGLLKESEADVRTHPPVLTQGDAEAQEPAARTARSRLQLALHARRDPLRDEIRKVGRGLSLADTQTGRYGRLYSRRRLCTRRGAARLLLRILLELVQLLATSASDDKWILFTERQRAKS
jgi:hypothetical protein